ncbi:MAG TPA: alpha/beta hydrolase [Bryobacteraceae bacterium]|nr:alpha/beta hydrolase [Bryobacteraceae bacterium]
MLKIEANGITVHYAQRGAGPELVLVHGITSSLAMWYNGLLNGFVSEYHVTAYDLRGHGLSGLTPTGYTSAALATDLGAILDALSLERVLLVGHSFGGTVALHYALENPGRVRGVVMMDSGVACLRYLRIIQDWWGWEGRPADMKEKGLSLEKFLELDSKQDVTEIIRHGLSVPRRAGFKKGQSGLTPRQQRLLDETKLGSEFREVAGLTEDRLATVTTPVLALYGENSPYSKMGAHLAKIMPMTCHETIPGIGHFYAVHKPQLAVEKILPFLRDPEAFVRERKPEAVGQGLSPAEWNSAISLQNGHPDAGR